MKRIIAMVDRSIYAESVVDHAAWLGRASGRSIDVVHVVDPVDQKAIQVGMAGLAVGGPGIVQEINHSAEKLEDMRAEGQLLVDRMTSRIASDYHGVVLGRVIVGEFRHVVTELQNDADALVIGKRGESADFVGLTLGSSLRNAIGLAQVPLVIAPRVFRAVSGWVLAVGESFGMSLPLTALLSKGMLPTMPCEIIHVGDGSDVLSNHLEALKRTLQDHGHPTSVSVVQGQPVRAVAERLATDETRLLAVGRFGRTRLLPQIFGDAVASDLTKASLGPILVLSS
jgi:nucleotide-binding universal stress UspA family protein